MTQGALPKPSPSLAAVPVPERRRVARRSANRKIGFIGHASVYALGSLLIFVVAGPLAGAVVLIGWGIALFCHGFFGVVAPILRERWVEEEIARHRDDAGAERALSESRHARALAELSASIAHEIRNPITAAKSLVQQMAESPAAPENAEYAAVAVGELDRVERSIAHLLRFAREEPARVGVVGLGEPVERALTLLQDRLTHAGIEVVRDLDAAGVVSGDPEQLGRVVANVVGNAIDALTDAGVVSPRIEIRAGENLARTEAWLTLTDNGPGIPEEALSRVFTPFYTSKAKGTGLGLPLCRKIVEEHGGTIEAKSEPGRGVEILITLPSHRPPREASA